MLPYPLAVVVQEDIIHSQQDMAYLVSSQDMLVLDFITCQQAVPSGQLHACHA